MPSTTSETECPMCGGPSDVVETEDPNHHGETRRIFVTRFAQSDSDAMALGRMQAAADTLGWTIDMIVLSAEARQYIVFNSKGDKIGNGTTRLGALQSANGIVTTRRRT